MAQILWFIGSVGRSSGLGASGFWEHNYWVTTLGSTDARKDLYRAPVQMELRFERLGSASCKPRRVWRSRNYGRAAGRACSRCY